MSPSILCALLLAATSPPYQDVVDRILPIEAVWSGHPVHFKLITHAPWQFAAYYDAERRLSVAARKLSASKWKIVRLPEKLGWDSHNSIEMVLDGKGYLHLCANMHCVPLVYFRSREPLAVATLERVAAMVGNRERRVTYPRFLRGPMGELIFTYRDGSSGNGDQIYDVYDLAKRSWRRLLDRPLTSGLGQMNAYHEGPLRGPDGKFHLAWIWRDTPDCETCHDICYARSADLVHWEDSAGRALELPITPASAEVVDPVPARGGAINGDVKLGFDSAARVVISYIKYDEQGRTQIYHARREKRGWKIYCSSAWEDRWEFSGRGSIVFDIRLGGVRPHGEGRLAQWFSHRRHGEGVRLLDARDFHPLGRLDQAPPWPPELSKPTSETPGMEVRWCADSGASAEPGVRYALRWETLGANRDRPRSGGAPPAVMLKLIRMHRH